MQPSLTSKQKAIRRRHRLFDSVQQSNEVATAAAVAASPPFFSGGIQQVYVFKSLLAVAGRVTSTTYTDDDDIVDVVRCNSHLDGGQNKRSRGRCQN